MTTAENTIQEIEISMEALKIKIEKGEILKRLAKNEDFNKLILNDFLGKTRLQDLLTKKVSPNFQDDSNKLYVDSQLTGVGALRMFMMLTEQEAIIAKNSLDASNDEINKIEKEGIA